MASKLTRQTIHNLTAPSTGQALHWDRDVRGLGIRVTANNVKSFVLQYRTRSGRSRRMTIGGFPEWTINGARKEARELLVRVDRGEDPCAARSEQRQADTIAELVEQYIALHLPKRRVSTQKEYLGIINGHILPNLRVVKVADLDRHDVEALHRKISAAGTKYRANRVLAMLSKLMSLAVVWGLRSDNPCKGIERNDEQGRERFLTQDEMRRMDKALAQLDGESANAIMLALLTGARQGELIRARWDQFDLKAGVWTKPAATTKQNKIHRVPLSPPAVELLRTMREDATGELVFPGRIGKNGRVKIRSQWDWVRREAGIEDVRFHDLRHSFASMLVSDGISLPIVGRLLGHTVAQTTMRYAHVADDPLREATARVALLVAGKKTKKAARATR